MRIDTLLAALLGQNDAGNNWNADHPLVLGAIFLALGVLLIFGGVRGIQTGVASGKWGTKHEGGMAQFISWCRVIGGVVACGFALYKIFGG